MNTSIVLPAPSVGCVRQRAHSALSPPGLRREVRHISVMSELTTGSGKLNEMKDGKLLPHVSLGIAELRFLNEPQRKGGIQQ